MLFKDKKDVVSLEAIGVMMDDAIIGKLSKLFDDLLPYISTAKGLMGRPSSKLISDKKVKAIMDEVDSIVSKKFGFNIKHVSDDFGNYGIVTLSTPRLNAIDNNSVYKYDLFKYYSDQLGNDKDIKTPKQIEDYNKDALDIMVSAKKSIDALEKQLETKGIIFNDKEATIKNLPKDFVLYISVNLSMFVELYNKQKLTGREMTAVLLHECGHGYTHIKYICRTAYNNTVLMEAASAAKDGDMKPIELAYRKLGGKNDIDAPITEETKANLVKLTVDQYLNDIFEFKDEKHSFTDSEHLADQFAARFGMGADLAKALHKMNEYYGPYPDINSIASIYTGLYAFLSMIQVGGILPALAAGIIMAAVIKVLFDIIGAMSDGGHYGYATYDDDKQRLERIKLDLIRQIRTMDVDRKTEKELLKQSDEIESLLGMYDRSITFGERIVKKFSVSVSNTASIKDFNEVIEKLMENKLYLATVRLEQRLKG